MGVLDGVGDGLRLIADGDPRVVELAERTVVVAAEATAFAAMIGVPLGCLLGLGRFRGRRALLAAANAGIRFPPIVLGQLLWLLFWPDSLWGDGPLAGLGLLGTDQATVLAQTLLALPVVTALTASATQAVPGSLLDQAQAFGASPMARAGLALREARVAVLAAIIAGLGVAISTVGAILIVGRPPQDNTLATAVVEAWNADFIASPAIAYGTVLLGLFFVLAAALTTLQHRSATWRPVPSS